MEEPPWEQPHSRSPRVHLAAAKGMRKRRVAIVFFVIVAASYHGQRMWFGGKEAAVRSPDRETVLPSGGCGVGCGFFLRWRMTGARWGCKEVTSQTQDMTR